MRYGAQCTWLGHEYVHAGRVDGWTPTNDAAPENSVMVAARDLLHRYDATLRAALEPPAA